jgi:hypothetical protein
VRARRGPQALPACTIPQQNRSRVDGGLRGVDPPGNSATAPQLSLRRRGRCVASNPLADGGTAWRGAAAHVTTYKVG